MFKKTYLIVISLLVLGIILAGCKEKPAEIPVEKEDVSLKNIMDKGYMVIGLNDNMPPLSYLDRNGGVAGFDLELMQEVTTRMGIELKLNTLNSTQSAISLQQKGDIDILNGFYIIPENEEKFTFSKPYIKSRNIIMVRKNSDIQNKDDLSDKKIGITADSSALGSLEADERLKETKEKLVTYETNQKMLTALGIGEIDAAIVNESFALFLVIERPSEFRIINEEINSHLYGLVFRKDDLALQNEIDKILSDMKQEGFLENLSRKWFKRNIIVQ